MVQEYPKMIYQDGDQTKEWMIVGSPEELQDAAELGFLPAGELPDEPEKPKRGRPRKGA